MHYLTYKKHLQGVSKRQIKRIDKCCDYYRIDLATYYLYYRPTLESAFLKIPKLDKRYEIAEQAHLLGHYNAISTTKTIKQEFFWPKMLHDVKTVINNCLSCKRVNRGKSFQHPAQALSIVGLFERIGIDLFLGLPSDKIEKFMGM